MNLQAWIQQKIREAPEGIRGMLVARADAPDYVIAEVRERSAALLALEPRIEAWDWLALGYHERTGWTHPEARVTCLYYPVPWGLGYGDDTPAEREIYPLGLLYTGEKEGQIVTNGGFDARA